MGKPEPPMEDADMVTVFVLVLKTFISYKHLFPKSIISLKNKHFCGFLLKNTHYRSEDK